MTSSPRPRVRAAGARFERGHPGDHPETHAVQMNSIDPQDVATTSHVLRVSFKQSGGQLVGRCWCGRTYDSHDPKAMWAWLDEHQHAEPAANDSSD